MNVKVQINPFIWSEECGILKQMNDMKCKEKKRRSDMAKKEVKTNAMRILDRMHIPYTHTEYECDEFTDGADVADKLQLPHEQVFKTLVTAGSDRQHYVFVIPVDAELDLKKCARSVGVKSVQMIHMKELFPPVDHVLGGLAAAGADVGEVLLLKGDTAGFHAAGDVLDLDRKSTRLNSSHAR